LGSISRNSLASWAASVLFGAITSVGRCSRSISQAVVADLPVPVAPSSTTSFSPAGSARSSSSMAAGWSLGLVAEDAEGEQHHVDVALLEQRGEHLLVRVDVERVEVDGAHLGAEAAQQLGAGVEPLRGAGGQDDPRVLSWASLRAVARAMSEEPPSTSSDCTEPRESFITFL
jgi:hypothetical protein